MALATQPQGAFFISLIMRRLFFIFILLLDICVCFGQNPESDLDSYLANQRSKIYKSLMDRRINGQVWGPWGYSDYYISDYMIKYGSFSWEDILDSDIEARILQLLRNEYYDGEKERIIQVCISSGKDTLSLRKNLSEILDNDDNLLFNPQGVISLASYSNNSEIRQTLMSCLYDSRYAKHRNLIIKSLCRMGCGEYVDLHKVDEATISSCFNRKMLLFLSDEILKYDETVTTFVGNTMMTPPICGRDEDECPLVDFGYMRHYAGYMSSSPLDLDCMMKELDYGYVNDCFGVEEQWRFIVDFLLFNIENKSLHAIVSDYENHKTDVLTQSQLKKVSKWIKSNIDNIQPNKKNWPYSPYREIW